MLAGVLELGREQEAREGDELVGVAVEEGVSVAAPLHPHLVALLEAAQHGEGARVPVVLVPGLALVVVDHAQHLHHITIVTRDT